MKKLKSTLAFAFLLTAGLAPIAQAKQKYFYGHWNIFSLSIDNKDPLNDYYATQYLNPLGENSKFAYSGGFLRDRPLPVPPGNPLTYQKDNLRTEILRALRMKLQGYQFNIFGPKQNGYAQIVEVADSFKGQFRVIPCFDMSGFKGPDGKRDPAMILEAMRTLYGHDCAWVYNKQTVYSAYGADAEPTAFWRAIELEARKQKMNVTLWPTVQSGGKQWAKEAYKTGVTIGTIGWGWKPEDGIRGWHIFPAYDRPNARVDENYEGNRRLRSQFEEAEKGECDAEVMATVNDVAEGTHVMDSMNKGRAVADVVAYYGWSFLLGKRAPIVDEEVCWLMPVQDRTMGAGLGWRVDSSNIPDLTVFLKSNATLEAYLPGTDKPHKYDMTPGVNAITVPIGLGTPRIRILRNGNVLYDGITGTLTVANPKMPDFSDHGGTAVFGP